MTKHVGASAAVVVLALVASRLTPQAHASRQDPPVRVVVSGQVTAQDTPMAGAVIQFQTWGGGPPIEARANQQGRYEGQMAGRPPRTIDIPPDGHILIKAPDDYQRQRVLQRDGR